MQPNGFVSNMHQLKLTVYPEMLAVARLNVAQPWPEWALQSPFVSISRTTVVQVTLAIALIVLVGLGLTTFLNYFKFERSFSLLIGSRLSLIHI